MFVYSPRFEGVHLRFASVARGGLRWSDRREDFRTEILGLAKAQEVKNSVIVPSGRQGRLRLQAAARPGRPRGLPGRGAGLLPDVHLRHAGRDRQPGGRPGRAAGRAWSGTTATTRTWWWPRTRAPRRSPTPPTRSRPSRGFWLGDAFASGGSEGYDHKKMGITARGAWESVRFHFRTLGVDVDTDDFTVVGIGDMSGDVFGNGMLLSRHIKLVAAFDHRHVFLDPDPDPEASFAERQRLFELPRSSWADYDQALISAGGGVWPRSAKSIQLSPQVRAVLGLPDSETALSPDELISAILAAPVDLLWNGGIGTYVKASSQSNADVGDRSNDAVRVDAAALRAKVVGEGGNLGLTQEARIEYALAGGLVNTDFIDNSAGVDTSDHEVNIKILLDREVRDGELTAGGRNELLQRDDRRGRRAGAGAQLPAEPGAGRVLGAGRADAARARPVHPQAGAGRADPAAARRAAERPRDRRAPVGGHRAGHARVLGAARADQDRRRPGGAGLGRCPTTRTCAGCWSTTSRPRCGQQVRRPDGQSPAAPGDHHHGGRQRHGGPVRHHLRVPAERGDRRVGARRSPRPGWSPGRSSTCRGSGRRSRHWTARSTPACRSWPCWRAAS